MSKKDDKMEKEIEGLKKDLFKWVTIWGNIFYLPTKSEECKNCDCSCHALGEHYPCHNPNCHPSQKQEEKGWEEVMDNLTKDIVPVEADEYERYCNTVNMLKMLFKQTLSSTRASYIRKVKEILGDREAVDDTPFTHDKKVRNKLREELWKKVKLLEEGMK